MTARTPRITDPMARAAEAFSLVWSSIPAELSDKISTSQLRVLITVGRSGVTTVTALARDLGALPSSATRLCDRLVAAGFLARAPAAANRRFHAVSLTPAGEQLLDVLDTHRRDAFTAIVTRMDPDDREALQRGLVAFAAAAPPPADCARAADDDSPASASSDGRRPSGPADPATPGLPSAGNPRTQLA
ncbi:MAG TPA: MarR family winged helix-turn-helix transcriptional regulator [Kineosporiaceae bacterium]